MSSKSAYEEKLQAQLTEWRAEIDLLKAKASNAKADVRVDLEKDLEELKAKRDEAAEQLNELKQRGDDAWEDLQEGMERAWDTLGRAVKSAADRFKH